MKQIPFDVTSMNRFCAFLEREGYIRTDKLDPGVKEYRVEESRGENLIYFNTDVVAMFTLEGNFLGFEAI